MKQQFLVTHIIRQTEILALLDIWVTNTTFSQNYVYMKKFLILTLS